MANPILSENLISDFERYIASFEYSHESAYVENTSGATINLKGIPYPLKAGTVAGRVEVMTAAESATPANIVGFLVTNRNEEIADGEISMAEYAYLVRGQGTIYRPAYPAADLVGAAYTTTNFDTWAAAVNPPLVVKDLDSAIQIAPYRLP